MRKFVNTFILLFLLDGTIAFSDALLSLTFGTHFLRLPAAFASLATWIFGTVNFVLLALGARPSKKILLPLILFLPLAAIYRPTAQLALGPPATELLFSLLQLAAGTLALVLIRHENQGEAWLFTKYSCSGPEFQIENTVRFVGFSIFLLVPLLVLNLYFSLSLAFSKLTAGFVHIDPKGVSTEERKYVSGNQTIYLLGMIHIADAEFYRRIISSIPAQSALVLAEGVSDQSGRLKGAPSYDKIASRLGVQTQTQTMSFEGYNIRSADVDTSRFSPQTVELLNLTFEVLASDTVDDTIDTTIRLLAAAESNDGPDIFLRDVINMRDAHLLAQIDESLGQYDTLIVPWGAGHMPGIVAGIRRDGFELKERHRRLAISF